MKRRDGAALGGATEEMEGDTAGAVEGVAGAGHAADGAVVVLVM